ncbi:transcriptional regulator, RpiR family [Clostridium sp. USBA 49]|jgi:DNA-binding MurR/RpiR family transcriptional regulator|uniref:MurR/RpiR family transcriptional regulator n=1 Tax=Clostridium sp. USBA 49 TaxID=1881060 RepID=UPI000999B2D3|nr:MurR/RpiR family transcriptional regulator [Clostridium sp. USBA 49]SKA73969.1 transcriptional regulator, RpiR family [Clostridium sp. USBA 49]
MKYKVIHKLKERRFADKISKSEESVLDYLQKHFDKIPQMTVLELSEQSYTSQATINRACKILGFNGFSELKYAIKEDLQLMNARGQRYVNKTEFFLERINFDSSMNIIKHFKDRNIKVMVYGLGASNISAQYFHRQLLYLGIPAILISEENMLIHFRDYKLIVFSSSGETLRILQVVKNAKESGTYILAITKKDSTLFQIADDVFYHEVSIDKLDDISREQQLHMIIMVNELIDRIAEIL